MGTKEQITSLKFDVNPNNKMEAGDINVAAQGDNSILARISNGEVTIYSANEINANTTPTVAIIITNANIIFPNLFILSRPFIS